MKLNGKVSIINLGCFKNAVDTEVIAGELKKKGFKITPSYEKSDWLLINTCGFIRDAKEESIETILRYARAREKGEIQNLYVIGCLSERYKKELENGPGLRR